MSAPLEILIFEKAGGEKAPQLVAKLPLQGRTELGRQKTIDETLYSTAWHEEDKLRRIVVAKGTEQTIGRTHLLLEPLPDGRLRLTNTSSRSTVQIEGGASLSQNAPFDSDVPPAGLVLKLGASRVIRV